MARQFLSGSGSGELRGKGLEASWGAAIRSCSGSIIRGYLVIEDGLAGQAVRELNACGSRGFCR